MNTALDTVVFLDLDGTLTDPKPGIVGGITQVLRDLSLPVPDDLTWAIGPPLHESFAKLGAPDPLVALGMYREVYGKGGLFEADVYAGIAEALALMTNYRLCLATAKPHVYARQITAHFGLDRFLTNQFGPELDGTRNDKAELLEHACETLGLNARQCIMVGDRGMDLIAARKNEMPFVGVSWGYARPGELTEADLVCDTVQDLPKAVHRLAQR